MPRHEAHQTYNPSQRQSYRRQRPDANEKERGDTTSHRKSASNDAHYHSRKCQRARDLKESAANPHFIGKREKVASQAALGAVLLYLLY